MIKPRGEMDEHVNESELFLQFTGEMMALMENPQRIVLDLGLIETWTILCSIQLAIRHPENDRHIAQIAREVALRIQEILSQFGPAIAEVARRGWDPKYDAKKETDA